MNSRNNKSLFIILLFLITIIASKKCEAKSVYAIINHVTDLIGAYKIDENQIIYQTNVSAPPHGNRVVDIAADTSSNYLFVTYERSNEIELINAKTMKPDEKPVEAPDADNLSGIVVEQRDGVVRVFTVNRSSNRLFVYFWDAEEKELTLEGGTYKELDYGGAMGISLNNIDHHLYVTNATNIIHYYDTETWTHQGSIDVGRNAYDIEVDSERQYIYTGGYKTEYHTYLVKTWIGDPNSTEADPNELDIGAGVIGLGLDPNSGLVYATTYHNELRVYDCSTSPFTLTDSEDIAAGAGVCVSDVSYKPPIINVDLDDGILESDDPNCVVPGDILVYTIHFARTENYSHYDVEVTVYLPQEVDFIDADPNDYIYNEDEHTCYWYIGDLLRYDPNTAQDPNIFLSITVQVNEGAEPLGEIVNRVEIESDISYSWDIETTPVCCWEHDDAVAGVIYVDQSAIGFHTGTCWEDAYVSLQSALNRADRGCGDEIWVARGVYEPGSSAGSTFGLVDDVEVYGGFIGNETDRSERNFVRNKTFLSGDEVCSIVVTADNVSSSTILDGFIIQTGTSNGIYCYYGDPIIANCVVMENGDIGIRCRYSEPTISDCVVKSNNDDGVEFYSGGSPVIERSKIYDNVGYGIYAQSASPFVANNWIHHNDEGGIYLYSAAANIRNNTIVYNHNVGVKRYSGTAPTISNCILWQNKDDLSGCSATYSCIEDNDSGTENIHSNPLFAYDDPNASYNYHLDPESPCIDAGNDLTVAQGETDIDGDDRIYDWIPTTTNDVDMGADEVDCEVVSNEVDWNADGVINFYEYAVLSNAWLSIDPDYTTDPNNWNPLCDLDDDHDIDLVDLAYFCDDWLWQACWLDTDSWMMISMGASGGPGRGLIIESLSPSQIKQAQWSKWLRTRPQHEPTVFEQLVMLDDIMDWMDMLWKEDEHVRKKFTEYEWIEFMKNIYFRTIDALNDYYHPVPKIPY